jgi:death-on-curing protein
MDDPIWISKELALAIHSRQLAEHGGADGVRDPGLLESALARPRQVFAYTDPTPGCAALAAAYAFGISKNHAFIDGNKRTAAVVCETFLRLNGFELTATDAELYPAFIALASGEWDEGTFSASLAPYVRRADTE